MNNFQKFSKSPPALWIILLIGYLPGVIIALISLAAKARISFPEQHNETVLEYWDRVEGLDA